MYSPERHRQLEGLQSLRQVRRRRAISVLQNVRDELEAMKRTLEETETTLASLEDERSSLFEANRGMTHRGGLLTLRRRASEIEMRRIHFSLTRAQLEADVAAAEVAEVEAQSAVRATQRQYDKLEHVAHLWQRDSHIHMYRQQEDAN